MERDDPPQGSHRGGRLWHGASGPDFSRAARDAGAIRLCGAAARGARPHACRNIAMANGRCHLHGGRSTGPVTDAGRRRAVRARWKHGGRSAHAKEERRALVELLRLLGDQRVAFESFIEAGGAESLLRAIARTTAAFVAADTPAAMGSGDPFALGDDDE